jgi:hypothetical protein
LHVTFAGDPVREVLKDACQKLMLTCQHVRSTLDKAVDDYRSNPTHTHIPNNGWDRCDQLQSSCYGFSWMQHDMFDPIQSVCLDMIRVSHHFGIGCKFYHLLGVGWNKFNWHFCYLS